MDPNEPDKSLDNCHRMKVQAYAETERVVTEVRKKLIREIEILSKLSHVRAHSFSVTACTNNLSQTLLLSIKHFARLILCKLAIRDTTPGG